MRFAAVSALGVAFFAIGISATALHHVHSRIHESSLAVSLNPAPTPVEPQQLLERAARVPKRPKFTKLPRPKSHHPHHHPRDCSNTNLVKNGDFSKNVNEWKFIRGSSAQFFWVKDSKRRPAHSGAGQAYVFINRGYSSFFLTTTVSAVEYANTITYSAWLRYEAPADVSSCTFIFTDNHANSVYIDLQPVWTKYSFDAAGTGRPKELQFSVSCTAAPTPITVYLDDVRADACVPKKPNPDCQVLPGTDNFLVNPGFECPEGIGAWTGTSYYGGGNETIAQASGKTGNPTHSGSGMAALLLDASQAYSGIAVYQDGIKDDMTRTTVKASFWLSVDKNLNNMTGCLLNVGTSTGYYIYDQDISYLTSQWTKFEIKNIEPTNYDTFQIAVSLCSNEVQPLIYLDDVYFGIDRSAPHASSTTTSTTGPTATATAACTSTPSLADPSFESPDVGNWLFSDHSPNYDTMFRADQSSSYGPPHAGSGVGVLDFPSSGGSAQLLQLIEGLCPGQVYTGTAWFYVPSSYDASVCTFSLGVTASSGGVRPTAAGVWTKVDVVFLASDSTFPYVYVGVTCDNTDEVMVLVDDVSFGPPPACSTTPTVSDGGFESGSPAAWDVGFAEGDESFAVTTARPRTGRYSGVLTFPSTSNGAAFGINFDACVGAKYTFHVWYFIPKAYKGITCYIYAYPYNSAESISEEISSYGMWVETKLDFRSGATAGHLDFGFSCDNQLKKVVIYVDDVSVTRR